MLHNEQVHGDTHVLKEVLQEVIRDYDFIEDDYDYRR